MSSVKLIVLKHRILCALAMSLGLAGCEHPAPASQTAKVTVAAALEREVTDWDEFTGRLQAVESVEIRPRVTGYIEKVAFEQGSLVKKGDVLFIIDPRPYQADAHRAQAELERARVAADLATDQLARARHLFADAMVSRDELDQREHAALQAKAAVAAATAALEGANLNLGFTQIAAPIAGRVGRALVTQGNLVQTGQSSTLLTTLVSQDPMYVEFQGDERIYLKYAQMARAGTRGDSRATGGEVRLGLADEEGFSRTGRMVFLDNQLDAQTGTIRARAEFGNADGFLTPGLFARVRVMGSKPYRAVLIDDAAIGTDQEQKFVLVLNPDSTLAYRPVRPGRMVDGLRVITSGLKGGEVIVVNGLQRVRPGMTVETERVAMDAKASRSPPAAG